MRRVLYWLLIVVLLLAGAASLFAGLVVPVSYYGTPVAAADHVGSRSGTDLALDNEPHLVVSWAIWQTSSEWNYRWIFSGASVALSRVVVDGPPGLVFTAATVNGTTVVPVPGSYSAGNFWNQLPQAIEGWRFSGAGITQVELLGVLASPEWGYMAGRNPNGAAGFYTAGLLACCQATIQGFIPIPRGAVSPIPEPATYALIAVGLTLLAFRRRAS